MTTLMQLRRLTRSRLGVPIADDFFDDATLDDNINLAIAAITAENRWPWNERAEPVYLAAGDESFLVPDQWSATRSLFVGDREVSLVSPTDLARWSTTITGPPRVWTPLNDRIAVRPTGGGELIHSYFVDELWLVEDSYSPTMPSRFAGAIVAKAAELLAVREDDRAAAAAHAAEYSSWLVRMRKDVRTSTGPTIPRVRPGSQIVV